MSFLSINIPAFIDSSSKSHSLNLSLKFNFQMRGSKNSTLGYRDHIFPNQHIPYRLRTRGKMKTTT